MSKWEMYNVNFHHHVGTINANNNIFTLLLSRFRVKNVNRLLGNGDIAQLSK